MRFLKLATSILLFVCMATATQAQELAQEVLQEQAQEKKAIKGFSGGMMVHGGYQYGGDNPYGLDIKSLTLGIGGCAKLHFSEHFRAGFEGYFSTAPIRKGVESGSNNKVFCNINFNFII